MAWRRKVLAAPEVEWTMPVQDLEPSGAPVDPALPPPPPPDAAATVRTTPRLDLQRAVLTACAIVATLALVVTAFMQRDLRDVSRRQSCLVEAQYRTFADSGSFDEPDQLQQALAECGVEFPDPEDE